MQLSTNDLEQLEQLGITPELLEQQLSNYTNGFPFIRLSAHEFDIDRVLSKFHWIH